MFAIDLDELKNIASRIPFFSRNRWNVYSFHERDHLNLGLPTLKENIEAYIHEQNAQLPAVQRIVLVTLPRVFGYIFNPVSFYFCHDKEENLICSIVEVGNTFREKKLYFLENKDGNGAFHLLTQKMFYVSPFMDLDLKFDFHLASPGERLDIRIDDLDATGLMLTSHLGGIQKPLTMKSLLWMSCKYPLVTLKVIFLIYWQALKIWMVESRTG